MWQYVSGEFPFGVTVSGEGGVAYFPMLVGEREFYKRKNENKHM